MQACVAKVKKYLFDHMGLAKQGRVFDPTQFRSSVHDMKFYPLIILVAMHTAIEEGGEWRWRCEYVQPHSKQFDIFGWLGQHM